MNAQRAVVQEAVPPEPAAEAPEAEARGRANSVAAALPLTPPARPSGDIESRARELAARFLGAFTVPKGTDVLRASGLHAAHQRHREAAAHWEAAAVRVPRRAWGALHLLLKGCLGLLDWVTESPARTLVAAIFLAACIKWL